MDTTGCSRCVAERRARWSGVGVNVVAILAIAVIPLGCLLWLRGPHHWSEAPTDHSSPSMLWVGVLVFPLVALMAGLYALERRYIRRASTPLPPPAPTPLATYRTAPAECPRHPFAR